MSDGSSEGEHRKSAAAQFARLGIKPKREIVAQVPAFPEPLRYLWDWFFEILKGVQGNGMTYPVISWEALHCWALLTRHELAPREAVTIVMLGNIWVNVMSEKVSQQRTGKPDATHR